ncbi:MAG TPA: SprT family zinc-dependent metalloprotease, partial [Candidatus Gracilibacteria bacterium]
RKALWLKKQVKDLKRLQPNRSKREYVSGESFLYLGRQYRLIVEESDKNEVHFANGRIVLQTKDRSKNQEILEKWYLERAEKVFQERYKVMLKKFEYDFIPELAMRKMEKRWGSFLAKKKVLLNPELIKASKECIDYVITHELCHMKYLNHSPAYYRFLTSKCPNWKAVKEELELRFTGYHTVPLVSSLGMGQELLPFGSFQRLKRTLTHQISQCPAH